MLALVTIDSIDTSSPIDLVPETFTEIAIEVDIRHAVSLPV